MKIDLFREAEKTVEEKYKVGSALLENNDDEIILKARDSWSEVIFRYSSLISQAHPKLLNAQLASGADDDKSTASSSTCAVPASPLTSEDIMQNLVNKMNPTRDIILPGDINPRLTVLTMYLSLLEMDELRQQGKCLTCRTNPDIPKEVAEKSHQHPAQHAWTCEMKVLEDMWHCPICAQPIPCPGPASKYTEEEVQDMVELFDLHCQACFSGAFQQEASHAAVEDNEEDFELSVSHG
ncbi:hypothetical protein EYR36_009979 [Pleurotus pulmonarius]|nr:hypothetical protein EYR36_009979 [Pleurotus pulmonarius]KAF4593456.1 hypothetical protein EYR38_009171 [Pleurotus pulmonarius]